MATTTRRLRVLIIEDVEDDALLLINELQRSGYQVFHLRLDTPAGLLHALMQQTWDLVLCDYAMPHMDGGEALKIVRAANACIPFIFVSGTINQVMAMEMMTIGAQGYVTKDNLKELAPIVQQYVG